jgi:hypothetical protein
MSRVINQAPFAVPSSDPDQRPNEPRKPEILTARAKATFQWPPDCVWSFTGYERDNKT